MQVIYSCANIFKLAKTPDMLSVNLRKLYITSNTLPKFNGAGKNMSDTYKPAIQL